MSDDQVLARIRMYKLLSTLFCYPDEELVAGSDGLSLVSGLLEIVGLLEGYGVKSFAESVHEVFLGYGDSRFQVVLSEYLKLFGQECRTDCVPYELSYLNGPLFTKTNELADITGFYNAFGLEVCGDNRDRLDHVGIELEFMYFLAVKEAYALENGTSLEVDICRDAQRKFLTSHLGRWTGVFHEQVKKNGCSKFYSNLSLLLDKFVSSDSKKLGALPQRICFDDIKFDDVQDEVGCGAVGLK